MKLFQFLLIAAACVDSAKVVVEIRSIGRAGVRLTTISKTAEIKVCNTKNKCSKYRRKAFYNLTYDTFYDMHIRDNNNATKPMYDVRLDHPKYLSSGIQVYGDLSDCENSKAWRGGYIECFYPWYETAKDRRGYVIIDILPKTKYVCSGV